jgi:hypothetical protein
MPKFPNSPSIKQQLDRALQDLEKRAGKFFYCAQQRGGWRLMCNGEPLSQPGTLADVLKAALSYGK